MSNDKPFAYKETGIRALNIIGRPEIDPRLPVALLRQDHGTLCHLPMEAFVDAARFCAEAIDYGHGGDLELIAQSYL